MEDFQRKIRESGEEITLGGALTCLLLDDPDYAWYVSEGTVNLFFVKVKEGAPAGARMPLFTLKSTMMAFAASSRWREEEVAILAIGDPDTKLVRIRFEKLREILGQEESSEAASEKLDFWLREMSNAAFRHLPPRECGEYGPGMEISLEDGTFFKPEKGVLWCEINRGTGLLLDNSEEGRIERGKAFAFSDRTWMVSRGALTLNAYSTGEFAKKDTFKESFIGFCGIILGFLAIRRERDLEIQGEQLAARRVFDDELTDRALHDVASALLPESREVVFEAGVSPLLAACKIIGRHIGISFRAPPDAGSPAGGTSSPLEELNRLARSARVKIRKVMLSENWWNRDCGPLLAFKEEDGSPVALIQSSPVRYEIFDPENRSRQKVDRNLAHSLKLEAYTFYRPFPEHKLSLRDLMKFGFKGTRRGVITALLMGLLAGLLSLVVPIATGVIFNTVIPDAEIGLLVQVTVILVTCAIGVLIFDLLESITLLRIQGKSNFAIEAALWDRLMSLPVSFFRKYTAGDLAVRNMGISVIYQLISVSTLKSIIAAVFSLLNIFLLYHYAPQLAGLCLIVALVTIIIVIPLPFFILRYERGISRLDGKISGMVLQFITGISKLRLTGSEGRAFGVWAREFSEKKILTKKSRVSQNIFSTIFSILPIVTLMLIFGITIYSVLKKGNLPLGNFMAFISANTNFQGAIMQMLMAVLMAIRAIPIYKRLKPILEATPETDETKTPPGIIDGYIDVNHVNFRYTPDSPLVLDDVSFAARPGEFIAIVGSSGAGKSTLLRILLGFDSPVSGSVYYDGKDVSKVDVLELRRQMGVVLQEGKILQSSILENIVGSSGLTIKEAWEAAEMAGCKKDIEEMPMQMYTYVTAGGGTISGGQRQRILIARAIIRKPRIIFFDEATSALDNATQAIVSRSLESLRATKLVIAHRLSTVINADRIYVLEKGRIVESGTYKELIALAGAFAKLARRQMV